MPITSPSATYSTSVILCSYTLDRWDDLRDGVEALRAQSLPPDEIVLVIDHNTALRDRAEAELAAGSPRVRIVENEGKRGCSASRNIGIGAATADIVAFLDDDAVPELNWLAELTDPFSDPDVYVSGGRAVPRWPGDRPAWWPEEFDWVVGCSHLGLPLEVADVRNVWGCSMACRREVFEAAGLFREDMGRAGANGLGCEDTELCIQVRRAVPGARVVYTPHSVVHHRVPLERARWKYFVARCYSEGISKAQVRKSVGGSTAVSSERSYVLRVLPAGVWKGTKNAFVGDLAGLGRAGAVVGGLATTGYGYARGRLLGFQGPA